jgi:hypothetical protein
VGAGRLPVRSIGDVRLAAILESLGCPLCSVREDAARRYVDTVLAESVNDVGFRARLAAGRGFCRPHTRQVLEANRASGGGTLGTAILVASTLRVRLGELASLPPTRRARDRRARMSVANAARPPDCPVCEQMGIDDSIAIDALIDGLDDPAWRSALAGAEICLDDLLALWARALERGVAGWAPVATAQLERLGELADRLEGFAHHSSFDRRHLMTDAERAASDDGVRFLGGTGPGRRAT